MNITLLETRALYSYGNESSLEACSYVIDFLSEEYQDDLFTEAQTQIQAASFHWGHFSNTATLLRSSILLFLEQVKQAQPSYLNKLNAIFLGMEGAAYMAEYRFFASDELRPMPNASKIESRYQSMIEEASTWQERLSSIGLGVWSLEAAYNVLSSHYFEQIPYIFFLERSLFHSIAPCMTLIMGVNIITEFNDYLERKERFTLATKIPESMQDEELIQIGQFIQNAQEPNESLYLVTCNSLKLVGSLAGLFPSFMWYRHAINYDAAPVIQSIAQYTTLIGTAAYALYGVWQATEWTLDKGLTWLARHQAAFNILNGQPEKAIDNLLGTDPEYIISRLLERLDEDVHNGLNTTLLYLGSLGIPIHDITALHESRAEDTKARQYLANALDINL